MHPRFPFFRFASSLLALAASHVSAQQTYYWNPGGSTVVQGGSGTINETTPLWNTSSTPSATVVSWTAGNHAFFGGSGGTITLGTSVTAQSIAFAASPDASYTLAGSTTLTVNTNTSFTGGAFMLATGTTLLGGNVGIGVPAASTADVTVNGTWISSGYTDLASGSLTVSSGGTLSNTIGYVGYYGGRTGTAMVTGAGSSWSVSDRFEIGRSGTGTLTIANQGVVNSANGSGLVHLTELASGTGTLRIGTGAAAGTLQAAEVRGGLGTANVIFDHIDSDYVFAPNLTGSVHLDHIGSGTTILAGENTHTGGTTLSSGRLQIGNGGTSGSIAGDILNDAVLVFDRSDDLTYGGVVSGSGEFRKRGSGILTLTGAQEYTGATRIEAGTLALGATGSLSDTGAVAISGGGTLALGADHAETIGTLTLNNGNITGTGTSALTATSFAVTTGTISAGLAGEGALTKSGLGTLVLSGPNTYSGGTTVTSDWLQIDADSRLGSGTLTLNGGGLQAGADIPDLRGFTVGANPAWLNTNGFDVTLAGSVSGAGQFIKLGAGTLTVDGPLDPTGGISITAGTLALGVTGSLRDTGVVTISGGATLALGVDHSETIGTLELPGGALTGSGTSSLSASSFAVKSGTISVPLTSGGALIKTTSGTVTLNAANTYSGGTRIFQGILALGASGSLPDTGVVTLFGGTLALGADHPETIGSLVLASGAISGTGTSALTASSFDVQNGSIAVPLAGPAALTKTTAGTVTLSGASTYAGGTTISQGTLRLGVSGSLPDTGTVTIPTGGTLALGEDHSETVGAVMLTGGSITGTFSELRASSLTVESGTLLVPLTGPGSFTKAGSGTFTLGVTGSYTGDTIVSGGTLAFAPDIWLPEASALTISGGTLDLGANRSHTVGGFTLTSGSLIGTGASWLYTTDISAESGTIATNVHGSGLFTKSTAGTVTLTGTNNYFNRTAINGGTLSIATGAALGPGDLSLNGGTLATTATLSMVNATTLEAGGGTVATAAGTTLTWVGVLGGTGALIKQGEGTLQFNGGKTYSGGTTISQGTLALGATGSLPNTGAVTIEGGTLNLGSAQTVGAFTLASGSITGTSALTASTFSVQSGIVSAPLTGAGALTKTTAGTVTLNRPNTYSGGTTILEGTLRIIGQQTLPTSGSVVVDGGTLSLETNNLSSIASLTLISGSLAGWGFPFWVGSADLQNGTVGLPLGGSGTITKSTAGTVAVTLALPNHSGSTRVAAGTLVVTANGALGTVAGGTTVEAGATLAFSGGFNYTTAETVTLSGTGAAGRTGALDNLAGNNAFAGNLVLDASASIGAAAGSTLTLSGSIGDGGGGHALTYAGPGRIVVSGTSTRTGGTTLSGGTLVLSGSAANSAFTVSGGTLSGSGTVGPLTVASGGVLAPGNSPGTLSAGDTTFAGGGSFDFQINAANGSAGTHWDLLSISGTLDLTGLSGANPFHLSIASLLADNSSGALADFDGAQSYSWIFVESSGGISGFFGDAFAIDATAFLNATNGAWAVTSDGNNLSLAYTASAIPEPSTYAALAGCAVLGLAVWRRRRSAE